MEMVLRSLKCIVSRLTVLFTPAFDWWRPIRISPLLGINMNYRQSSMPLGWIALTAPAGSIFRALRIIPHGHGVPLKPKPKSPPSEESPYTHFFNVYKPNTPYKKTNPPVPDFAISVVR